MSDKIKINIESRTFDQMFEYAYWAKKKLGTEIAGWGHWNKDNGIYKLAPLLKQIGQGSEVNTFPDAINNDITYDISDMVVQWHSHVDMPTSPSTPDQDLIKKALKLYSFLISIIVNCKGEYSCEVNISKASNFLLPDTIHLDAELIRYYGNSEIKKEVWKNLKPYRPPKPKVIDLTRSNTNVYNGSDSYGYGDWYNPPYEKRNYGNVEINGETFWGTYNEKGEFKPYDSSKFRYEEAKRKESLKNNNKQITLFQNGQPVGTVIDTVALDGIIKELQTDVACDNGSQYALSVARSMRRLLIELPKEFKVSVGEEVITILHLSSKSYCVLNSMGYVTVGCAKSQVTKINTIWKDFLDEINLYKYPYRVEDNTEK